MLNLQGKLLDVTRIIKENPVKSADGVDDYDFDKVLTSMREQFHTAGDGVAMISNIVLEGEKDSGFSERVLTDYFPEINYGVLVKKGKTLEGLSKEFFNLLIKKKMLTAQAESLEIKPF